MIRFLIDSASDIDMKEAEALGVTLLPMQIMFGDVEYLGGVNLSHKEFYEKLIESDELPKTSQINEYRFAEAFKKLTENGDEVVAITMSSKLSGTYSCAVQAAEGFGGKVVVIDSLNVCIGERILFEYGLSLKEKGLSIQEIKEELDKKKQDIQVLAVLDTLVYLKKGGRISSAVAFAGELLSIKPVVSVVEGEVKLVGKAFGSKKGNNLLMQLMEKCGGIDFSLPYAVGYSGLSDAYLQKYLTDSKSLWENETDYVPVHMVGSTIGTHVGPNAIAVSFFAKK